MYRIIITNGKYENTYRSILKEAFKFLWWTVWITLERCPDTSIGGLMYHINYWKFKFEIEDHHIQDYSEEQIWEI